MSKKHKTTPVHEEKDPAEVPEALTVQETHARATRTGQPGVGAREAGGSWRRVGPRSKSHGAQDLSKIKL